MKIFYNIIFLVYSIICIPALLFKGKFHRHFLERFGIFNSMTLEELDPFDRSVWIHAVSVGEVSAVKPIVEALKNEFPSSGIVVSTTTICGHHLAKYLFSEMATVIYFPLDISFISAHVISVLKPALFCMMETELWPNLILALSDSRIPIVLMNGRISDKSIRPYRAVSFFMRPILTRITKFCMQSGLDADRVISIGARRDDVTVTGNMKFDLQQVKAQGVSVADAETAERIRRDLKIGAEEEFIIAGSTHHGEEKMILAIYKELLKRRRHLRLLIAPRHIERSKSIESLVRKKSLPAIRVSRFAKAAASGKVSACDVEKAVLVLDTIGQLKDIYSSASMVFMGGSLVKRGGHNLIEPAVYSKAILFGPHMFNFRDMSEAFINNRAAIQVEGPEELSKAFERLLNDKKEREELGMNARRLIESNSGATQRTLEVIKSVLRLAPNDTFVPGTK